jgi:epsilon-lactone hydrolase
VAKLRFSGTVALRLSSFLSLSRIALATHAKHVLGRRMEPTWDANFETGIRFWRHQFTRALNHSDIAKGREILDSLQTETDVIYDVTIEDSSVPKGRWYRAAKLTNKATLLYLHGGGYTFYATASVRFAALLAHHNSACLFAPDYPLTPEHPHPAQAEAALAAWYHVTESTPAERVVLIGDSAGGHMALMLLQTLRSLGQPQPALCIGLCPWTDIGARGDSLHDNNPYDLVQGWMALRFGELLDPTEQFGRAALSPIHHDYKGLAPIYLQAGGREILCDMISDFARVQAQNGADVMLDLWQDMPHDFQLYDNLKHSSTDAISRLCRAISAHSSGNGAVLPASPATVVQGGIFV